MTPSTPKPRVLLVDWDRDFAALVRQSLQEIYHIEHLLSAPELLEALAADEPPVAVLIDVDAFRIDHGSPLFEALTFYGNIQCVLLTQLTQLSLSVEPRLGTPLIVAKEGAFEQLPLLLGKLCALPEPQASDAPEELSIFHRAMTRREAAPEKPETNARQRSELVPLDFVRQRQLLLGRLASSIGHELNNLTAILSSVGEELQHFSEEHGVSLAPEVREDLAWVDNKMRVYAESLLGLGRSPQQNVDIIDLSKVTSNVIRTLDALGTTKYVGVETNIDQHSALIRMSREQLELMIYGVLIYSTDGVMSSKATIRRLYVDVRHETDKERVTLSVRTSAGAGFFEKMNRALDSMSLNDPNDELVVAKRLVDANGGVLRIEFKEGEGTALHAEFPTQFAAEVTLPALYQIVDSDDTFEREDDMAKTRLRQS